MKSVTCTLTPEGYKKLVAQKVACELQLKKIAQQMDDISLSEDTSDNEVFQELRCERMELLEEIARLQNIIANASIIRDHAFSKAMPGCRLSLSNHQICHMLQLVSPLEANSREGRISCNSPLGTSLLGKRVGDVINFVTPMGATEFEIKAIA